MASLRTTPSGLLDHIKVAGFMFLPLKCWLTLETVCNIMLKNVSLSCQAVDFRLMRFNVVLINKECRFGVFYRNCQSSQGGI